MTVSYTHLDVYKRQVIDTDDYNMKRKPVAPAPKQEVVSAKAKGASVKVRQDEEEDERPITCLLYTSMPAVLGGVSSPSSPSNVIQPCSASWIRYLSRSIFSKMSSGKVSLV